MFDNLLSEKLECVKSLVVANSSNTPLKFENFHFLFTKQHLYLMCVENCDEQKIRFSNDSAVTTGTNQLITLMIASLPAYLVTSNLTFVIDHQHLLETQEQFFHEHLHLSEGLKFKEINMTEVEPSSISDIVDDTINSISSLFYNSRIVRILSITGIVMLVVVVIIVIWVILYCCCGRCRATNFGWNYLLHCNCFRVLPEEPVKADYKKENERVTVTYKVIGDPSGTRTASN